MGHPRPFQLVRRWGSVSWGHGKGNALLEKDSRSSKEALQGASWMHVGAAKGNRESIPECQKVMVEEEGSATGPGHSDAQSGLSRR